MASKNKNRPVTDILSKASKALAKSRQLRDPGKIPVHPNKIVPKKTSSILSRQSIKVEEKANNNLEVSSSDDDDVDILLDEKSPSTFMEAMDNLYNSTALSTRKTHKTNISADVNIRSDEINDFSLKSDISSGTPSISLTTSEKGNSNQSNVDVLANLRMTRGQMTMQSSTVDVKTKPEVIDEIVENVAIGKTHNSLASLKIPASPVHATPHFTPGTGHPHATVEALMRRGDKVSEETYRVLQMMVRGPEDDDEAYEQKHKTVEVPTDSVEDDVMKTDASISMALEEEEIEDEFEAPVSLVSENVTYVGGTIDDIVENLMSLDLEEEEEMPSNNDLEPYMFEFKADNTQEESCIYPEEEEEYEDEEEASMTLKEYIYASDFEPESSKQISISSARNTKSEISRTNNTQSLKSSKSTPKSIEKSVSFSASANKASKSSNKLSSKNLPASQSEKATVSSARVVSLPSSAREIPLSSPTLPGSSSTPTPQSTVDKMFSLAKSRAIQMESLSTFSAKHPRSRERRVSQRKIIENKPVEKLQESKVDTVVLKSDSKIDMEEIKESTPKPRRQSSSKSKSNVQPSKSRLWKNTPNPIDDLMNIDGERSSRQRQKILSILRKELYEKELKRLNREQMKTERLQKKREKELQEQEDDYRMLMNFRASDLPQDLPEVVDSWESKTSYVNRPGKSTDSRPPHLSQMISLMNKYNFAAAGLQNKPPSRSKTNVNFGAPYFTRSGDLTEGNFRPPEQMEIPELVHEVLDSHHRMYAMTIQTAKQMGKKYKDFLKEQNKRQENKSASQTKVKPSKVNLAG